MFWLSILSPSILFNFDIDTLYMGSDLKDTAGFLLSFMEVDHVLKYLAVDFRLLNTHPDDSRRNEKGPWSSAWGKPSLVGIMNERGEVQEIPQWEIDEDERQPSPEVREEEARNFWHGLRRTVNHMKSLKELLVVHDISYMQLPRDINKPNRGLDCKSSGVHKPV
jgi:hypothetical protein